MENILAADIQQNDWRFDHTIQFLNLKYLTYIFKYPIISL